MNIDQLAHNFQNRYKGISTYLTSQPHGGYIISLSLLILVECSCVATVIIDHYFYLTLFFTFAQEEEKCYIPPPYPASRSNVTPSKTQRNIHEFF
jgi:hypothetical protein